MVVVKKVGGGMKTIGGFRQDRHGIMIIDIYDQDIMRLAAIGGFTVRHRRYQAHMLILLQKVGVI